jgi:DNA repair protein RecO (recombination protein O)
MLQPTNGIVLRSVKYGETSLISTVFTEAFGVQSYIVKGVRSAQSKHHKAALLQPATLLELVAYHSANKNIQYLREFHCIFPYQNLQEQVVKNSIALFSVELLLRLLPPHAPLQDLFAFCLHYFQSLDRFHENDTPNFPLYFMAQSSKILGYELKGNYTEQTPFLNIIEGGFSKEQPLLAPSFTNEQTKRLSDLVACNSLEAAAQVRMNATTRFQLLEWYLSFLQHYAQHLGVLKSLSVLRTILH